MKVTFLKVKQAGRDQGGASGTSAFHSLQIIIAVHLHRISHGLGSLMRSNLIVSRLVVCASSTLPFVLAAPFVPLDRVVHLDVSSHLLVIRHLTGHRSRPLLLVGPSPHHRLRLCLRRVDNSIVSAFVSTKAASRDMLALLHVLGHDLIDGDLAV